jgi:hypothetical protein
MILPTMNFPALSFSIEEIRKRKEVMNRVIEISNFFVIRKTNDEIIIMAVREIIKSSDIFHISIPMIAEINGTMNGYFEFSL